MQPRPGVARKVIIQLLLTAVLLTSVPVTSGPGADRPVSNVSVASASPRSTIRLSTKRLKRTKALLAKQRREAAKVRSQLAQMDIDFEIAVEKYNDIRGHLRVTEGEIDENLVRLSRAIKSLDAARELLNDRVVNIYKQGKADTVDVFLNANGFNQVLVSLDLLRFIADADKDMVLRIAATKREVQDVQEQLLAKRERQRKLQGEIEAQKKRVHRQIVARRWYLSKLSIFMRALLVRQRAEEKRIAAARAKLAALALARSGGHSILFGTGGRQDVVRIALSFLGIPYVWGGESRSGVDCSGLVLLVFREVGINLPHHAADQYNYGRSVSRGELQAGDLVFFSRGGAGDIYHVAIYIGSGNIVEAPFTGASVWVKNLDAKSNYYGAKRLL